MDIEKELNELIKKCTERGGFVWIVDKHNNFYTRLTEEVKISSFVPKEREDNDDGQ